MWLPLILISAFFYSASTLFRKKIMDFPQADPIAYAIGSQFAIATIIAIFILVTKGGFSEFDFKANWINFVILTLGWGFGNIFLFKALKHITLSKFTILFSLNVILNVLINSFVLEEYLNFIQIVGLALVLIAVAIIALNKNEKFSKKFG